MTPTEKRVLSEAAALIAGMTDRECNDGELEDVLIVLTACRSLVVHGLRRDGVKLAESAEICDR